MTEKRTVVVTAGIMIILFLASMEVTVVATAMPSIVAELGGLATYSWVFSGYLLTSTTTVPLYGKLSDIYGRRPVYAVAVILFIIGSFLCGQAASMTQLIWARGVQGLGAGGLIPLAFIIAGELFDYKRRAQMQGVFSSVWGVSAVVGPLLGGFLVDQVSWRWVFYINLPPALIAAALVWLAWRDTPRNAAVMPPIDYAGALVLSGGLVALLLAMFELGTPASWALLSVSGALFAALIWVESNAADPVLPIALFRDRMFAVACAQGLMIGSALFGSVAFVPLFAQAVLGTNATVAGAALTPMVISWTLSSIVGARLLLKIGYRAVATIGMVLAVVGIYLMTRLDQTSSYEFLLVSLIFMGIGMGFSIPSFLIAVQSSVARSQMGTATSTLQFSRNIGGTVGVSVMGAVLSAQVYNGMMSAGLDPASVSIDILLEPAAGGSVGGAMQMVLAGALQSVFVIAFVTAVIGLGITLLSPSRDFAKAPVAEVENSPL